MAARHERVQAAIHAGRPKRTAADLERYKQTRDRLMPRRLTDFEIKSRGDIASYQQLELIQGELAEGYEDYRNLSGVSRMRLRMLTEPIPGALDDPFHDHDDPVFNWTFFGAGMIWPLNGENKKNGSGRVTSNQPIFFKAGFRHASPPINNDTKIRLTAVYTPC